MESQVEQHNKLMLRQMVDRFPREFKYAERIERHLKRAAQNPKRRNIREVSEQIIYRVANGKTNNPQVAYKICVAFRLYRIEQATLNKHLKQLIEG